MPIRKTITWPGCLKPQGVTITRTLGVVPDAYTLRFVPQTKPIARKGTLQITCGTTIIKIPDCIVSSLRVGRGERGRFMEATILDGRWAWRYGQISGSYNAADPDGKFRREKTPQQLAALLLQAMGVTGYDVSKLPNSGRPRMEWDYDIPARQLDELCLSAGCCISYKFGYLGVKKGQNGQPYQPFPAGKVVIERFGQGSLLPRNIDLQHVSINADPKEAPTTLSVVTDHVAFETILFLEPLGEDRNGDLIPVDQLPYKPAAGWFRGLHNIADREDHDRATRSVFLYYRVQVARALLGEPDQNDTLGANPLNWKANLPFVGRVDERWQILPLSDDLVRFQRDPNTGDITFQPCYAFGIFQKDDAALTNNASRMNEANRLVHQTDFTMDKDSGIIKFRRPVRRVAPALGDGTIPLLFPILALRCNVTFRPKQTGAIYRHRRDRKISDKGTGARSIDRRDLKLAVTQIFRYTLDNGQPAVVVDEAESFDNRDRVDEAADQQIDATLSEYAANAPGTATYRFIQPFETDGAIREIVWQLGDGGLTSTTLSRSDETSGVDYRLHEKVVFGYLMEYWENRMGAQQWSAAKTLVHQRKA